LHAGDLSAICDQTRWDSFGLILVQNVVSSCSFGWSDLKQVRLNEMAPVRSQRTRHRFDMPIGSTSAFRMVHYVLLISSSDAVQSISSSVRAISLAHTRLACQQTEPNTRSSSWCTDRWYNSNTARYVHGASVWDETQHGNAITGTMTWSVLFWHVHASRAYVSVSESSYWRRIRRTSS
jgi:hypothetical protein